MTPETDAGESDQQPFIRVLPGLLFLTTIFLLNFVARIIFAPLLPVIADDLGLSHADSGSLFLFISAGYIVAILGSGFVSASVSHKQTIVLSTTLTGCFMLLLPLCTSLIQLSSTLLCIGLAAGLYLPSGLASIAAVVSAAYLGRGVAIHELAPNAGFVLAPFIAAFLLNWLSWSESLLLVGLVLIGAGAIYGLRGSATAGYGMRLDPAVCRGILARWEFWIMVLLFSQAICSTLGLYAMLPLYLVKEHGYTQAEANTLVALSRLSSIFMPLAGGWLADRFGYRRVMAGVLFLAGLLAIPFGLVTGTALVAVIVLQPMIAVCFFPAGFAVLLQFSSGRSKAMAVSLCIPLAFLIGGGVMPLLIGLIGDHFSLAVGFVSAGAAICAAGSLALVLHLRDRKNNPAGTAG